MFLQFYSRHNKVATLSETGDRKGHRRANIVLAAFGANFVCHFAPGRYLGGRVCLPVSLYAWLSHSISQKPHSQTSQNFLCTLPGAVA